MQSVYDWVTLAIFAGLIVLFLHRSSGAEPRDSIWAYLAAGVGCAIANYLGNQGHDFLAIGVILATIGYVIIVLKPIALGRPR